MASSRVIKRYWDASCFLTLLNDEDGAEDCEKILNEAKEELTVIYVSPIVQVEVVRPRSSGVPIPAQTRELVQSFFENDYVKWRIIDRDIANSAQELCWDHNLHPRDAIHLAVALDLRCDVLETYDSHLLKCNDQLSDSPMVIQKPVWKGQPELFGSQ